MPITVICPNLRCRSILQVPNTVRGKKVKCGKCQKNFIVPEFRKKIDKPPPQPVQAGETKQ